MSHETSRATLTDAMYHRPYVHPVAVRPGVTFGRYLPRWTRVRIQAKLDELLRAVDRADDRLVGVERPEVDTDAVARDAAALHDGK